MTEPIRTPVPDGLKRVVRVSNIQHGTSFVKDEIGSGVGTMKNLIAGILRAQSITIRELIGCLLSEPYSISPKELDTIAIALDSLNRDGILKVGFRLHNDNFDIEPVFQVAR